MWKTMHIHVQSSGLLGPTKTDCQPVTWQIVCHRTRAACNVDRTTNNWFVLSNLVYLADILRFNAQI